MITIENLSKRFGDFLALDRVGLKIETGELFFLLGPSGCGKTTLLRHVAGFYQPDEGRILFDGEDVTRVPPHRRNTGMVFQNYALWPHLTVAKNVAFGLEERHLPKPEIEGRVAEALRVVRLEDMARRKIHELSGGQQQRVALARALVIRPACLLLDEPLSNLDANLRLEMRGEIRRICRQFGLTSLYVTHDQQEALSIADRIAILDGGKLLQVGTPAEIYRRPRSRFVAEFIGEGNFLVGQIVGRDEFLTIKVGNRSLRAADPPGHVLSPGSRVVLCLRPEAIRISDNQPPGPAWRAKLLETTYLGQIAQHRFHCGTDTLKVAELNPRPGRVKPGSEYYLGVDPEEVTLLGE
ncbi:MAG: ABC transporter ATP-binding protein [Verrucomicrobia bacterium]|nr:ABC transporter ATP-binding protein [Verrucomicrobiota bacterium]